MHSDLIRTEARKQQNIEIAIIPSFKLLGVNRINIPAKQTFGEIIKEITLTNPPASYISSVV